LRSIVRVPTDLSVAYAFVLIADGLLGLECF
jgi:hypothetical protein